MKRDMDLARAILLKVQESDKCDGLRFMQVEELRIDGHSDQEIAFHVMLLHEGGLLVAEDMSSGKHGLVWLPMRLTNAGYEFLEASKNEGLWRKAKSIVKEKVGGLSFEVLKAVLIKQATDLVTGPQ